MSDDPACSKNLYSCGDTVEVITSTISDFNLAVKYNRNITAKIGATTVPVQKRNRNLVYIEDSAFYVSVGKIVLTDDSGGAVYNRCGVNTRSSGDATFSESYETTDTELLFVDLRNETIVAKEIKNKISFKNTDSTAPSKKVSIFTGYNAREYYAYIFDSIPIEETITTYITVKGVKTILHEETIARGFPYLALIMSTFPSSPFGIRIDTAWAQDIEWYRQDLRKTEAVDGDAYLFRPEWCDVLGQLSQELDDRNTSLMYQMDHQLVQKDITGTDSLPEILQADMFNGSVAFDTNKNMFYSIAVNTKYYAVDPEYIFKNKLVIDGVETELPTEQIQDKVTEGDPPVQKKDSDGNLVWTDPKDSEYDAWYPIAPL